MWLLVHFPPHFLMLNTHKVRNLHLRRDDETEKSFKVFFFCISLGADYKADCNIILILCNFSRVEILSSLYPLLARPSYTYSIQYVSVRTPLSWGCWEVILGNVQYGRKSVTGVEVDEAGLLKRWIAAFQCKITPGMPRTSQDRWYLILTEYSRVGFPLQSRVITVFPLMKTNTKDETGDGEGEVGTLKLLVHDWQAVWGCRDMLSPLLGSVTKSNFLRYLITVIKK